jgi:YjjG family noncanonical pyrimidine nucleotidase
VNIEPTLFHLTYKLINDRIWTDFENGLIDVISLKTERFRKMGIELGFICDPKACSEQYMTFLSHKAYPLQGMYEILDKLKDKARLAIVSNGLAKVQYKRIELALLDRYFKDVFLSEELGASKPDKEYFEKVFLALDWKEHQKAIIIGDNLNSDIRGGQQFGITTCWANLFGKEHDGSVIPDYTIYHLDELEKVLF